MQTAHIDKSPETGRWSDVTGVILAGGKSSRMGRDKASLEVGGTTLFERVLDVLQDLFPSVLIAGDRPDLIRVGVPCHPDIYPGSALGGLYTGLLKAQTDWVFVAPCDMPHVEAEPIRVLLERRAGQEIVVPRTRAGLEPLFALYHKACLEPMRSMLEERHYRIYDFYGKMRVRYVEETELPPGWERALVNVNTPEEYRKARKRP
jgi:molybdopterin-guanine dinucleotide biosynthesis protein A